MLNDGDSSLDLPPERRPRRHSWLRADFLAGLMLLAMAAFVGWFGRPLAVGTAWRMGPGYVPMLLAWIIAGLGVSMCAIAFRPGAALLGRWPVRPIVLILGAMVVFAFTIERAGLLIATMLAVALAGLAAPRPSWRSIVLLAVCLAAFACLLFPFALQLPLKVLP